MQLLRRVGGLARTLGDRRKKLHRVAYTWCRDCALADDLVQETLAKALKNIGHLRDAEAIDAWLFRIMANCWRDHFRRERLTEDISTLADLDDLASDGDYDTTDVVSRVRAAVAQLPLGQREVLALVDLQGFSYPEVAELLNIPLGTVTSRICRAREALRVMLLEPPAAPARTVQLRRVK